MSIRGKKNFQNGKIYQITSHCGDKIYIGSTTKKYLSQRMDKHRSHYKQWKQNKAGNITVFELFHEYGLENCQILLLELYPCNSNDELTSREGHYIRTMMCVNKVIPGRTQKEYHEDNKVQLLEKAKQYYADNKEELNKKHKQYHEANREVITEYQKQYYDNNKELVLERMKQYRKIKVTCGCGSHICQGASSRHNKSIKHQQYLKLN